MAHIFISYAREDEARIQPLVRALEKEGWSVFWDRRIPAGQTWRSYIGKALTDASCVIVVWSLHSIASSWVSEEADEGKQRGILVPVLLDPVEPPIGFRSIQAANLTDSQSERPSPRFEQLLHDIRAVLRATPTPSPIEPHPEKGPDISGPPHEPPQRKPKAPLRRLTYGAVTAVFLVLVAGSTYWVYQTWFSNSVVPISPPTNSTMQPRLMIENARLFLLAETAEKASMFSELEGTLAAAGFNVIGKKTLKDEGRPDQPEIRYFNAPDKEQAEALAEFMRVRLSNPDIKARQYNDPSARPGYIEIWLGR